MKRLFQRRSRREEEGNGSPSLLFPNKKSRENVAMSDAGSDMVGGIASSSSVSGGGGGPSAASTKSRQTSSPFSRRSKSPPAASLWRRRNHRRKVPSPTPASAIASSAAAAAAASKPEEEEKVQVEGAATTATTPHSRNPIPGMSTEEQEKSRALYRYALQQYEQTVAPRDDERRQQQQQQQRMSSNAILRTTTTTTTPTTTQRPIHSPTVFPTSYPAHMHHHPPHTYNQPSYADENHPNLNFEGATAGDAGIEVSPSVAAAPHPPPSWTESPSIHSPPSHDRTSPMDGYQPPSPTHSAPSAAPQLNNTLETTTPHPNTHNQTHHHHDITSSLDHSHIDPNIIPPTSDGFTDNDSSRLGGRPNPSFGSDGLGPPQDSSVFGDLHSTTSSHNNIYTSFSSQQYQQHQQQQRGMAPTLLPIYDDTGSGTYATSPNDTTTDDPTTPDEHLPPAGSSSSSFMYRSAPELEMPDATYEEYYGDAYVGGPIKYIYPSGYQSLRPRSGPWKLSLGIFLIFTWLTVFIVGHCSDRAGGNYDEIDDDALMIETRWCGSRFLYFMWVVSVVITGLAAAYCSIIGYIKVRDFAVANSRSQPPGMVGKSDYYVRIVEGEAAVGGSQMVVAQSAWSVLNPSPHHHHGPSILYHGGSDDVVDPTASGYQSYQGYRRSIYQADGTPQFWGGQIYRPTQAAVAVTSR